MINIEIFVFGSCFFFFFNCFNFQYFWHQGVAWIWGGDLSPTHKGNLSIALRKMK